MAYDKGALARYAQQVYEELGEGEREGARRVFVQLVQPGEGTEDTRRVATRAELGVENWPLVQHLADRRLVVTGRDPASGRETVEVVHEALIQRWDRLRGWIEEDRAFRTWQERLRGALAQWQATGRDEGGLLRGAPLGEAEGWLADRGAELSSVEAGFIESSVEMRGRRVAEREQRRRRTILALAGGLVVALILVLVAVRQRQHALVQAGIGLASQALLELDGSSPERAALLALEALENYPYTWQAERALGQAVLDNRLQVILQHEGMVNTVQWSSDGTRILTASNDGTAKVWNLDAQEAILTLAGHKGPVQSAAWSPTEDRIVTSSWDGTAKVWDASASSPTYGEELITFAHHEDAVLGAEWSPDGTRIVTASSDGTAKVWDASASSPTYGEEIYSMRVLVSIGGTGNEGNVAWSPDGLRIVTTSGSGRVWDATTGERLLVFTGHAGGLVDVAWSPNGTRIVTAGYEGLALVWDAITGEKLGTLRGHTDSLRSVAWSPAGKYIATTDWSGGAKIWDAATGDELLDLYPEGYDSIIMDAAWSPDGSRVVTASFDGKATVWDAATGTELVTFFGHKGPVTSVVWSPSGDHVVTASDDGTAEVWDIACGSKLVSTDNQPLAPFNVVAWSPAGDRIVTGNVNGAQVWDAVTGARLLTIPHHDISCVAWSPSGDQIATGDLNGWVSIWDAVTGDERLEVFGHLEQVVFIAWSPDGGRIATTGWDSVARIWDAATGRELVTLSGHTDDRLTGAAWSSSGDRIVTASFDGTVRVWDASASSPTYSEELLTLSGFDSMVTRVLWSADGTRIITHSNDGFGRVWDVSTFRQVQDDAALGADATVGEELVTFSGHTSSVWGMRWSPAGDRLLTGSFDSTARVWDINTGMELVRYSLRHTVFDVDWSPDGTRIVVASSDDPARVLPAWQNLQELIDYAKECCVIRELTPEERELFGLPAR